MWNVVVVVVLFVMGTSSTLLFQIANFGNKNSDSVIILLSHGLFSFFPPSFLPPSFPIPSHSFHPSYHNLPPSSPSPSPSPSHPTPHNHPQSLLRQPHTTTHPQQQKRRDIETFKRKYQLEKNESSDPNGAPGKSPLRVFEKPPTYLQSGRK